MRFVVGAFVWLLSLSSLAAPTGKLNLPAFNDLRRNAAESVDISLGSLPLHLARAFADSQVDAQTKDLLKTVQGVYVRSYEFDSDFAYPLATIEQIRAQLSREGWSPLVQVKEKDQRNVDISVALDGDQVRGVAIVATEPREFTIVNIVGAIDVKRIGQLQEQLGLPKIAAAMLSGGE
jgi:hypothetical protein